MYKEGWVTRDDMKLPSYVSDHVKLPRKSISPDFEINLHDILKPGTYEQKNQFGEEDEEDESKQLFNQIVTFQEFAVPLNMSYGSKESLDFLVSLRDTPNTEVF